MIYGCSGGLIATPFTVSSFPIFVANNNEVFSYCSEKSIKPVPYSRAHNGTRMAPWIRLTWWTCHSGVGNFSTSAPSLPACLGGWILRSPIDWLPRKGMLACDVCNSAGSADSVVMKINNNLCYHYWLPSLSDCVCLRHGVSVMGSESSPQEPQALPSLTSLGVWHMSPLGGEGCGCPRLVLWLMFSETVSDKGTKSVGIITQ